MINGGVVQYDDLQKYYFLKKYGLKYNPDLIIFSHDIDYKPWIDIKKRTKLLREINYKIPKNLRFLRYLYRRLTEIIPRYMEKKLLHERGGYVNGVKWRYEEDKAYLFKVREALRQLSGLSEVENIPVIVMLLPWLSNLEESKYPFADTHSIFSDICKENGLAFLDLYENLFKNMDPDVFSIKVGAIKYLRPNPYAHQMIAKEIFRFILSSGKMNLRRPP